MHMKTCIFPQNIIFPENDNFPTHTKIPFWPKLSVKHFPRKWFTQKSTRTIFPENSALIPNAPCIISICTMVSPMDHPHVLASQRCSVPRPARTWPSTHTTQRAMPSSAPSAYVARHPLVPASRRTTESARDHLVRSHCRPATIQGTLLSIFRSRVTRGAPPS